MEKNPVEQLNELRQKIKFLTSEVSQLNEMVASTSRVVTHNLESSARAVTAASQAVPKTVEVKTMHGIDGSLKDFIYYILFILFLGIFCGWYVKRQHSNQEIKTLKELVATQKSQLDLFHEQALKYAKQQQEPKRR